MSFSQYVKFRVLVDCVMCVVYVWDELGKSSP